MEMPQASQRAFLAAFCAQWENPLQFVELFDAIPELECFVKDAHGRRLGVSSGIWKRLGFASESAMIGKSDHDLFPPHVADQYVRSDAEVLQSGRPLKGVLEIWVNELGHYDWFVIDKWPLRGRGGAVIGVMGTIRKATGVLQSRAPDSPLSRVVDYLHAHFREPIRRETLSKVAGLSERQLLRRFQQEFGVGLTGFVVQARVHAGADALRRTEAPIAQIAQEVGFCDQSAFTRAFRQQIGMTPKAYRLRYRRSGG